MFRGMNSTLMFIDINILTQLRSKDRERERERERERRGEREREGKKELIASSLPIFILSLTVPPSNNRTLCEIRFGSLTVNILPAAGRP